ncbi:WhiB family transcriptional regulator [Streptomyces sp. CC228A]|uniref:WhiB family transcriptional regulator n=1 Tax=Streptomyces sp. CC228A TaxID=2898186 RepID=UPI001F1C272A|nr:WhiB family transcriptional regulator [Streptomyces sp. CC228A]
MTATQTPAAGTSLTLPAAAGATRSAAWQDRAACRGLADDTMYPHPTDAAGIETARRDYCNLCPVRIECLTAALDNEGSAAARHRHGICAGTTPEQRAYMHTLLRQGRSRAEVFASALMPPRRRRRSLDGIREYYEEHAAPADLDGHRVWSGKNGLDLAGRVYTPNQVAFMVTRRRAPQGWVRRTCDVARCVAHLADERDRVQQDGRAAA